MRYPTLILTLAGASFLTGCSSLISLNPFISDTQATTDPRLVGTWKNPAPDEKETMSIEEKDKVYTVKFTGDNSETVTYQCRLARLGDLEFWDLVSSDDDPFVIRPHTLMRLWVSDAKIRWAFIDSDWMREQAKKALATQENEGRTLITTQGEALMQFWQKFAGEDQAHGDITDLVKVVN